MQEMRVQVRFLESFEVMELGLKTVLNLQAHEPPESSVAHEGSALLEREVQVPYLRVRFGISFCRQGDSIHLILN